MLLTSSCDQLVLSRDQTFKIAPDIDSKRQPSAFKFKRGTKNLGRIISAMRQVKHLLRPDIANLSYSSSLNAAGCAKEREGKASCE